VGVKVIFWYSGIHTGSSGVLDGRHMHGKRYTATGLAGMAFSLGRWRLFEFMLSTFIANFVTAC
jgi:hypothetical protein